MCVIGVRKRTRVRSGWGGVRVGWVKVGSGWGQVRGEVGVGLGGLGLGGLRVGVGVWWDLDVLRVTTKGSCQRENEG